MTNLKWYICCCWYSPMITYISALLFDLFCRLGMRTCCWPVQLSVILLFPLESLIITPMTLINHQQAAVFSEKSSDKTTVHYQPSMKKQTDRVSDHGTTDAAEVNCLSSCSSVCSAHVCVGVCIYYSCELYISTPLCVCVCVCVYLLVTGSDAVLQSVRSPSKWR